MYVAFISSSVLEAQAEQYRLWSDGYCRVPTESIDILSDTARSVYSPSRVGMTCDPEHGLRICLGDQW